MACFPDEVLFRSWQEHNEAARKTIWARLWELKTPIGYHFCLAAFRGYRDGAESAKDVASEAFYTAWGKIDLAVQAKRFKWSSCPEFNVYFKKIYTRHLIAGIKKKQHHLKSEVSFEDDLNAAFLSQPDQGIKRVETKLAVRALVFHYSCTAERLRQNGDVNSAEIAEAIVTFIKCEIAYLIKEFTQVDQADLPVEIIRHRAITELLDAVIFDSQVDLGKQFCPQSFPVFLMKELCGFTLTDEMRSKSCDALRIRFTVREENGRRSRITQKGLMNAHKVQKKISPQNPKADKAYNELSTYLRCRNLVDKRWGRFKQAVEQFDSSPHNHKLMLATSQRS